METMDDCFIDVYEVMFENFFDGIIFCKVEANDNLSYLNYRVVSFNKSFERLTGLSKQICTNMLLEDCISTFGDLREILIEACFKVCSSGESDRLEFYSSNLEKWYWITVTRYMNNYISIAFQDITLIKLNELKLKESEQLLQFAIDSSANGVWDFNIEEDVMSFSRVTEKILGIPDPQLPVKLESWINRIHPDDRSNTIILLNTHLNGLSSNYSDKYRMKDSKGDYKWIEAIGKVTSFKDGKPVRITGIYRDVTEAVLAQKTIYENEELIQEAEYQIKKLYESLAYENLRTEFFANISHELRTPINVILSALHLIKSSCETSPSSFAETKHSKYLNIMKQNCFRLLRLVNNLIDITKIDAGYYQIDLHNRDIVSLVEDVTLSVADYIQAKSIELIFDTEKEEKIIAIDEDKLERIMLNLLSNAVKFTKEGGSIFVNLYENKDKIIISVKDTGIGIPQDKLQVIFDRFRQVDKSFVRTREGSGLGLSIVKSLVELHGGSIHAKSVYGQGSEFIIELPVKVLPESEIAVTEDYRLNDHEENISIEFSDIYI